MIGKSYRFMRAVSAAGVLGLGVALIAAPPAATATEVPAAAKKMLSAAQAEGKIRIVWAAGTMDGHKGTKRFERGFNKFYGTNLKFAFTPGPAFNALARRLVEEKAAGRSAFQDIVITAGAGASVVLDQKKILIPVNWGPLVPHISPGVLKKMTSSDGALIAFVSKSFDIAYNTKLISKADSPKSLKDLLDPKWKGRMATTPYAAAFGELVYDKDWGEERLYKWARAFAGNLSGLMRCTEHDRITSGEFPLFALACASEKIIRKGEKGQPLAVNIPTDVMRITHYATGVPKHSASPNAAQLLIAWMLMPEGQKVVHQNSNTDLHYFKGSTSAKRFAVAEKATGRKMLDWKVGMALERAGRVRKAQGKLIGIFRAVKKKK